MGMCILFYIDWMLCYYSPFYDIVYYFGWVVICMNQWPECICVVYVCMYVCVNIESKCQMANDTGLVAQYLSIYLHWYWYQKEKEKNKHDHYGIIQNSFPTPTFISGKRRFSVQFSVVLRI